MGGPKNKTYKRSWKNLLLDKSYQLRFTLFMVGLSAVLMGLLGWWVMVVAERATKVAKNNVRSVVCKEATPLEEIAARRAGSSDGVVVDVDSEMKMIEPGEEEPPPAEEPSEAQPAPPEDETGPPGEDRERPESNVTLGESSMELTEPETTEPTITDEHRARHAAEKERYESCTREQNQQIVALENRQDLILWVLIGVGLLLVVGLFAYGLKMTHRVAGPLYKVGLYLNKLRDNKYDTVYNLRKGDHLVEFYEHFKSAHQGLREMQEEDIERLKAMIEAAEEADLASKSPEIAAALQEMRAILKAKEESLV